VSHTHIELKADNVNFTRNMMESCRCICLHLSWLHMVWWQPWPLTFWPHQ